MARRFAIAVAALLVLVGCSGGGNKAGSGTGGGGPASAVEEASIENSSPAPEGSGPESPQAPSRQPSIPVASLPIGGGSAELVDGVQCLHVFLTGVDGKLPDGSSLAVTDVDFSPDGVFSLVDANCGGSDQACPGQSWSASNVGQSCLVAAKQNDGSSAQPGDSVAVNLKAELTCADAATCAQLQPLFVGSDGGAGSLGGSQLALIVQAGGASPSASDTDG